MDAAELWNSCPPMDFAALEAEILGTVLARDNYLFFRTSVPPIQFAEETATGWEMYCTACHRPFWREKKRNFKPGKLEICPECGRVYVSGGTTRTTTASDSQPEQPVSEQEADAA